MRQYVAVKFRPEDRRSYTYHHDGAPVSVGQKVRIPTRSGGEQTVEVCDLPAEAPPFPTKAILGLAQLV